MNKNTLERQKATLQAFVSDFERYVGSYNRTSRNYGYDSLKTKMQRQIRLINRIVTSVQGGCELRLDKEKVLNFYQALSCVLTNNVSEDTRGFLEENVAATINEAIGNIENNTIPSEKLEPILPIKDATLKKRCSDLLSAPGSFDRVINQATLILEDRLRSRIPFEQLCEIIPEAKKQRGEDLAHKLLGGKNPPIVVSDKAEECLAFHKMVIGIIAYLRNPSHHTLNDDTEWVLAWSVVGIIDSLLAEIDNAYVSSEEP